MMKKSKLQSIFNDRQFMLSDDFEIYYYSDNKFNAIKDHTHDYYEFYVYLNGESSIFINGESNDLMVGDMYLISPNTPHHVNNKNKNISYSRFVFWINKTYFEKICRMSDDYNYIKKEADLNGYLKVYFNEIGLNELKSKIFKLIEEINTDRFGKETKIELCLFDLLLYLNRYVYEKENIIINKETNFEYDNLLTYINNNLDEDLTLDMLSKRFYINKYYLSHLFKENFGISIHKYIMKKRLEKCKDALLSNKLITEIYLMYGFKDYTSFFRAFKKEYGLSPQQYKQKLKKHNLDI